MVTNLTGGFDASHEYNFPECPAPGIRDASNMWVSDDRGVLGFPKFAVECIAPGLTGASENFDGLEHPWDMPHVRMNLAFPDGRVYRFADIGKKHPTDDSEGRHSILGAGPLEFRCVEPFRSWTASFQGTVTETSTSALIAGNYDGREVDLDLYLETTMAVPPWKMGSLLTQGEPQQPDEHRFEQLFRANGTLRVGDEEHTFTGSGSRIRRQGVRKISGLRGHCWQSALFPSGKAFGSQAYPPRSDGVPSFNEGYLFTGDGALIPARVVQAPWLRKLLPRGDDLTVVLESELGTTTIEGETVLSTYEISGTGAVRPNLPGFPVLQKAGVRYRWDGEETYGMVERSSARDLIQWP